MDEEEKSEEGYFISVGDRVIGDSAWKVRWVFDALPDSARSRSGQSRRSENRPIDRPILSFGAILVRPCLSSYIQTCAETVHQLTELLRS